MEYGCMAHVVVWGRALLRGGLFTLLFVALSVFFAGDLDVVMVEFGTQSRTFSCVSVVLSASRSYL